MTLQINQNNKILPQRGHLCHSQGTNSQEVTNEFKKDKVDFRKIGKAYDQASHKEDGQ